ncbi:MAG: hypothetical protein V7K21_03850 [Nostoc sp.]|uniref:hypothetical protein n=1 Tax=Nostoc sp. TaxID=1180 RepID=UPI002FF5D10B
MQIVSIRELENVLNSDTVNQSRQIRYNFLSNVSQEIQDIIENRRFTWEGNDPLNAFPVLNANLIAKSKFLMSIH